MIQSKYLEVVVENLPKTRESDFVKWLFRQGCQGTVENLHFTQPSLQYEPRVQTRPFLNLTAYFDPKVSESLVAKLLDWTTQFSPQTRFYLNVHKNRDWLTEWKKHFKPFEYCGFEFSPAWVKSKSQVPRGRRILIEPGMAFGTGTHATTQFAIFLMVDLASKSLLKDKSVLDVGAGSGILSVVGERLGAREVTALDVDPECYRVCNKMFRLNRTKNCKVSPLQLEDWKKSRDIVVANIIDGVLLKLKRDLTRVTKKGGYLILSGILTERAKELTQSFTKSKNFKMIKSVQDSEWFAMTLEKVK